MLCSQVTLKEEKEMKWKFFRANNNLPFDIILVTDISGWEPLVNPFINFSDDNHKGLHYKALHEAARKDVKRAFGALKKQWVILATPARAYIKEKLANIMYTCIVLHNMILKDRKEAICPKWYPKEEHQLDDLIRFDEQKHRIIRYIKSSEAHQMLKADLIEHVNCNV
ncbi:ALP1-like protein [Tanacetum coccineum]